MSAAISLYLDLEEQQNADLEVVGRASLAFAAAIKELAYVIDPSLEVRIEFTSGTAGSLSLNSIIKAVRKAKDEPLTLGAVVIVILLWFGGQLAAFTFEQVIERVLEGNEEALSETQLQQIKGVVERAIEGRVAGEEFQRVYREIERDHAIKGVGATTQAGARPSTIVPREEFAHRAGMSLSPVPGFSRRTVPERLTVVLVSPVLVTGERRWKFRAPWGEFGAPIKDRAFIERVLSGTTAIPMVAGIQLDVELETDEEFRAGVWTPVNRTVTHVHSLHYGPSQISLPLSPEQYD